MFVKIISKTFKNGNKHYYASIVENKKIKGKVVQTIKAYIGAVKEDQIPYLKAAYMDKDIRPKLVYENKDDELLQGLQDSQ